MPSSSHSELCAVTIELPEIWSNFLEIFHSLMYANLFSHPESNPSTEVYWKFETI